MRPHADNLLSIALSAAVPLWIDRLKRVPFSELQSRASVLAQIVAEKGDVLQYRSKKVGDSAAAFNALAEGIACLAFSTGGVTFAGMHWEAEHPEEGDT